MNEIIASAVIRSGVEPDASQLARLKKFLYEQYGKEIEIVFKKEDSIKDGFVLKYGYDSFLWTRKSKLRQLKTELRSLNYKTDDPVSEIKTAIENWSPQVKKHEVGNVVSIGDGIARVSDINNATYGEILNFVGGVKGMILDMNKESVGCVLFGRDTEIAEGSVVSRSHHVADVPVGNAFLGRVVDALGNPVDGLGEIEPEKYMPVEAAAPGIVDRKPVSEPLETGLLVIDSMFPIGKGQRELIIGDRQTGKTTLAIDAILNQKGKDVICIYAAIGQKESNVASVVNTLKKHGVMDNCIVVKASAGESVPMEYLTPYSATAMGEYFMKNGRDVLIVYDDLSKHAVAYRTLSLLLGRSPGREAYPGDVFYLHSRLLERCAKLKDELGGGSMTALPVVETLAGDVSAYIPTNIISITDGQIFLERKLFFKGQRPAVNVGLSVSRVGGAAQTPAMKKVSGKIRLELAQYNEMAVFTQFSDDLDDITKKQLKYGEALNLLLRQNKNSPLSLAEQVILLTLATAHIFDNIEKSKIEQYKLKLLEYLKKNAENIYLSLQKTGKIEKSDEEALVERAKEYLTKEAI